jgi:hypothetical protein
VAKAKKFELESPAPILDEQDQETVAAIDEGIRDAKLVERSPAEEIRKRLRKWITGLANRFLLGRRPSPLYLHRS